MPVQFEYLDSARINGIMQGLQDPRLMPQQLVWDQRIPDVDALEEEIMARFIGTVQIADLVADDAKAVVYSMGKFQFESTKVPNLKLGVSMNQAMLNVLSRLQERQFSRDDGNMFSQWENRTLDAVKLGIAQRREALKVAMLLDGLTYDRLGIKMSNVTWGMLADLKVTPATPWTTAGSATPVDDLLNVKLVANTRYGINFNRASMSTPAFRYMIATTDFQNKARMYLAPNVSFVNLSTLNVDSMKTLAQNVLGLTIETYDARYWSQDTYGAIASYPFMPVNQVILTDTGNDNNSSAWDFANGIVTETVVSNLAPVNIAGRLPVGRGPIAYATAPADLNSPSVTYWGVQRGFPRKHLLQASAVLTVGSFSDQITVGVPFPA